jgi:hypothetical protein
MPVQESTTIHGHKGVVVAMGWRLEWLAVIAFGVPAALVQRLKTKSA